MLQKRLWTALLALVAVAMTAGGALANVGDITLKFNFDAPEAIRDFRYSRQGETNGAGGEVKPLPDGVKVTSAPSAKTVTFTWPTNYNFPNIDADDGEWFYKGYIDPQTPNSLVNTDTLTGLTVQSLNSVGFMAGNIVAAIDPDSTGTFYINSIEVSGLGDNTTFEGYFAWNADTQKFDFVPYNAQNFTAVSSGHIVVPLNDSVQIVPAANATWAVTPGSTIFLIISTSNGTGYYIPVLFDRVEEGGVNVDTADGVFVDESPTELTANEADLGVATLLPLVQGGPVNCQLYRPDTVDDRHYPIENPTSAAALKPALMKTQLTITLPKDNTTGTWLCVDAHGDEHAQPGNLWYFDASGAHSIAFAEDNRSGVIWQKAAENVTAAKSPYYLQVYVPFPGHYTETPVAPGSPNFTFSPEVFYKLGGKTAYFVKINVQTDQTAAAITTPSADGTTATAGTPVSFAYTATDRNGTAITGEDDRVTITAAIGSTSVNVTRGTGNAFTVTPTAAGMLTVTVAVNDGMGAVSATRTVTVAAADSGSGTTSGDKKPDEKPTDSGTTSGDKKPDEKPTDSGGTPVTPVKTAVTLTPATGATAPTVKAGAETTVTFTVSPDVAGKAEVKVADTSIATATAAYRTVSTAAASGGTVSVAVKGVKAGMTKATLTFTPTDSTRYTAPAAVTLNITVTASGSSSEPDGPTSDKDSDTEKKAEAILENLDTSTPGGAAMAEKLSNTEDKAAAVDAVEALERAGTDVSTLSSKDVEALVQNKKAEEADKEKEKSGSVPDPTVPAASELLDSATALSVSPKVVKPTPVTNEAVLADMKTGIENFTAEKDSGVDSSAVTAAKEGLQTADKIDIADAATSLTEQTKVVEDLFNMVSADLTKFGSNGVVIATVLPKMTPKASGFFPLSVNLRHLTPGRVLRFWLSPAAFTKKATGAVSVAEATEGQYFFLDENGVPTSVVTGDPAKMKLVVYLTAVQSASLAADQPVEGAFITVDGTPDDKTTLEEMTKSDSSGEGGEGGGNSDGPTSNKGSGGCDALSGGLALLALIPLFMRKRS